MPIDVTTPDGSTVSFPDGTDAGVIHNVMRQHFGGGPRTSGGPEVSTARALGEGFLDTAGFGLRDEWKGMSEASGLPSWMGGFRAPVGLGRVGYEYFSGKSGEATRTYEQARDETRRLQKAAQEQHPSAFLAGQIGGGVGGALGGAVLLPGAAAAEGAGVLARAGSAARSGAAYGGLYGFGSGEGLKDSAIQAGVGAGVGGALGGAFSPAVDAAQWAKGQAARAGSGIYQAIRAGLNPEFVEDEAARRILRGVNTDVASRGFPWDDEAKAVAARAGIDRATVDTGGERTMALARSAANVSPEARAALTEFSNERFFGQTRRAANFIKDLTGGADAAGDIEAIRERARAVNRPAYERAYRAGDRPVWSDELERLTGAPAVQQAMKSAVISGQDRSIEEGFGAFNPGVTVTPDGRLLMGQTLRGGAVRGTPTYPNMQYWDYVQRDLADMVEKVQGREPDKARYLNSLHQQLNTELDRLVPQFQHARMGAWRAFQSEDAVEAGKKFVAARGENSDYARDIARMSGPDRELFARGYASELADRALELRDNQNLLNQAFVTSPAAKERHAMALGPDRAKQLEVYLRAESLADRLRNALGNSTTARQLHETALAGAGGLLAGEGLGFLHGGEGGEGHALGTALALGGAFAAHKSQVVQQTVARRIGEMLASGDPAILNRGVKVVARSEKLMNALRAGGDRLAPILARITQQQTEDQQKEMTRPFYGSEVAPGHP